MLESGKSTFWKYLTYLCTVLALACIMSPVQLMGNDDYEFSEEDIKKVFEEMETIVDARYTPQVKGHIVTYVKLNRDKTNRLLDRASIYFPIIEKYLHDHNLPDDLKYLAIVESALIPSAKSRAGAVGLWQFMTFTGREHGLRQYSSVDERRDPHAATLAAMQYLTTLYDQFGDWALAMAAYNSGPGRVRSAIRRSGSKDFWVLYRYLPRETRGYIPAFIAATYVFKHHRQFGFEMPKAAADLVFTERIMVYDQKVYFKEIAEQTGLSVDLIKQLNPGYLYHYVPKSSYGYGLTLPKRVVPRIQAYLAQEEIITPTELVADEESLIEPITDVVLQEVMTSFYIEQRTHLEEVAAFYELDPYQIKYWNNLEGMWLNEGMELIIPIYLVEGVPLIAEFERKAPIIPLITPDLKVIDYKTDDVRLITGKKMGDTYTLPADLVIRRGESVYEAMLRARQMNKDEELLQWLEQARDLAENYSYGAKIDN